MEPEVLYQFLQEYGQLLKREIQLQLDKNYTYAPGYNKDAYSRDRKLDYAGNKPKSPFGIGNLSKSIDVELNVATDSVDIYMLDYWKYVNYGRKEGKYVPIKPLEDWARSKGLPDPRSAAFAISKNIQKFGIMPTKFYENALDNIANLILERFEDDADDYIDALFGRIEEKNITL